MSSSPSNSTGIFYAYAKHIKDDWSSRYLITFATRDVADTWFRAVVDSVATGYTRFASVKRVSPQFYTFNNDEGNIRDTINDPKVANALNGQVFFTLLHDRDGRIISMIPVLNYRDHINGESFYIRSVAQPDIYWYYDKSIKTIVAHPSRRSQFIVTISDWARALGTVIIGSDQIFISTTTSKVNIGVKSDENQLSCSSKPFPIDFSAFGKDFQIDYWDDDDDPHSNLGPIIRSPGSGERWELV
ncbi:hypothetical protein FRB94_007642 [Tulasnella sp. JGI-2019a]|nr:hypothetical protein FRB94_007642 [Tulasnella sp. JGI-2019a]KAG9026748.1 hypothetical protein FRB95_008520 [Tulasnella sp. JGI-2019a]